MGCFEYDNKKSGLNKEKHGLDFAEAEALWNDQDIIEVQAKSETEPRLLVVGMIKDKHWSAVITYRGENIRIISVRRSRKLEVELYESQRV
jgi:uncharacterized protein